MTLKAGAGEAKVGEHRLGVRLVQQNILALDVTVGKALKKIKID